ncbi:MAG: hypothetical protein IJ587_09495 [Synergistaceae bacterium]|nr:hypothetical protein [Synergistaceae bacterium]
MKNLEDLLSEDAPFEDDVDDEKDKEDKESAGADEYREEKLPKSRSAKNATDLLNDKIG